MSEGTTALAWVGLDGLGGAWRKRGLPFDLAVGEVQTILGEDGQAGSRRPLRSSVAELRVGAATAWIPAPIEPGNRQSGNAPVFRIADADSVLPTIRLFRGQKGPDYLTFSDWVLAAFEEWLLPCVGRAGGTASDRVGSADGNTPARPRKRAEKASVLDRLKERVATLNESAMVSIIAEVLRFCLLGFQGGHGYRLSIRKLGLKFPRAERWLRKIPGVTDLARVVSRRMVLTARIRKGVPGTSQAALHRIRPAEPADLGIDPVHTPEGKEKIRFVGYLAVGVGVTAGRLFPPAGQRLHLSPSTVQVPFAQFDAPRRLLPAANMQIQAVPLDAGDPKPVVRLDHQFPDPPGVNLRVAYMAWQGWNHEDAWVLSESAAERLGCHDLVVQSIAVSSVECPPAIEVQKGEVVRRGKVLLRRRVSPALLAPEMDSLIALARVSAKLEEFLLPPDETLKAADRGTVEKIETWDLATGQGIPDGVCVPAGTASRCRMVVRFHIRRPLPLEVGDKLANRHGHKGIVGRILPDKAMPRWQGKPLDALIDPVSVLNRSNWGQVYETLLGAVLADPTSGRCPPGPDCGREEMLAAAKACGCDLVGRSKIDPPEAGDDWMSASCWAVAGVQWVMRLPKHAAKLISASLPKGFPGLGVRRRRMRLGEQGTWAFWAHGLGLRSAWSGGLSAGAQQLEKILAAAGVQTTPDLARKVLRLRWADLSTPPSDPAVPKVTCSEKRDEVLRAVGQGAGTDLACLVFGDSKLVSPVTKVYLHARLGGSRAQVSYVMIPPGSVRPAQPGPEGRELEHELTRRLKEVARRVIDWHKKEPYRFIAKAHEQEEKRKKAVARLPWKLREAIRELMKAAYNQALGAAHDDYKDACIGRELLCPRLPRSGRAVASPAGWDRGDMKLELDEVGLPIPIARAVLNRPDIQPDEDLLAAFGEQPLVWLKRDPVLHRWGLLRVKVRVVSGNTVLLPASLLRPLGADFDGDAVVVFGCLPGEEGAPAVGPPSATAWDEVLGRAVFYPGKQYAYGIDLLQRQEERLARLNRDLKSVNAPPWPRDRAAKVALEEWAGLAASQQGCTGAWWATVERHALEALAEDPGMGLGLYEPAALGTLKVVECGAAKEEVFTDLGPGSELFHAYNGESLDVYAQRDDRDDGRRQARDMIATVMVAGAVATGHFGNVPRRFIYAAKRLEASFVHDVHALSERANQQVLSVKVGAGGLNFEEFDEHVLKPLSHGSQLNYDVMPATIRSFLDLRGLKEACDRIRNNVHAQVPGWLRWLRRPAKLGEILSQDGNCIELPLEDPRVRAFCDESSGPEGGSTAQPTAL
jgi:hypothetical protein